MGYPVYRLSVSRLSTDTSSSRIRAAYNILNSFNMLEGRVMTIDVLDQNQEPAVDSVKAIKSRDPSLYSVMYATFIETDYVDKPPDVKTNTAALYWVEAPRTNVTAVGYAARYIIFDGSFNTGCPQYLSVQGGQPRTWEKREDVGDYMAGGFFWKNSTLNYVTQWVEPDGIHANIITLPYQFSQDGNPSMTITAAWQRGEVDEIQVYDWLYKDYRSMYDRIWPQGWRFEILKAPAVNGQIFYTAVWRLNPGLGEIQVYDWNYNDFRAKYDELWPQGWRFYLLNNHVLNGQVLYTAVWHQNTDDEIQVYGWNYVDYHRKYDELWPQGWRLFLLENFVLNGQILYTAVWRRSTAPEIQVYGWSYSGYRTYYDNLWPKGWRLFILNNYIVNKALYTAVWRQSTAPEIQVYWWSYENFRKKYDELWRDGWRLKLLDVVV